METLKELKQDQKDIGAKIEEITPTQTQLKELKQEQKGVEAKIKELEPTSDQLKELKQGQKDIDKKIEEIAPTPTQLKETTSQLGKFFFRYWPFLVAFGIAIFIFTNNTLFNFLGTLVYVPALSILGVLVAILLRNVFNANTTDKYVDAGQYREDFDVLPARDKVWLTTIQFWIYLGFSGLIILAAVK